MNSITEITYFFITVMALAGVVALVAVGALATRLAARVAWPVAKPSAAMRSVRHHTVHQH